MAVDLLSGHSQEVERLNIISSLVEGRVPQKGGEALIGDEFAKKLNLKMGDTITFMSTTMNSSMTFENFTISGTIRFGVAAMDKGMLIVDIADARKMLDMQNAAGEILGFSKDGVYFNDKAVKTADIFNAKYANSTDEFAPVMLDPQESE